MKGIIFFGAIAVMFALSSEDVLATINIEQFNPGDEVQSNRLAGDSTDQKIMDTDIKRSGMNEMNEFLSMSMMRKEEPCEDTIPTEKCLIGKKKGYCGSKNPEKYCKKTCDLCDDGKDIVGGLRYGDTMHLLNQYGEKSYLDTCGGSSCSGVYKLQTTLNPISNRGSGTWQIISVNGDEGPVNYKDKIHLLNQYGRKSYLDTCGNSTCRLHINSLYNVQTAMSPNRNLGSGTWEVISKHDFEGPVKDGDQIYLKNQYGIRSYLDTCGVSGGAPSCQSSNGVPGNGVYFVQTSTNPNRDDGSGTWEIEIVHQRIHGNPGGSCPSCPEYGIDYRGDDINEIPDVYPWTQCAKICKDSRGCEYWTWDMNTYKCYLKTSKNGRKRSGVSISGAYDCLSDCGSNQQPLFKDQCSANEFVLNRLEELNDTAPSEKGGCGGIQALLCISELAKPIATCASARTDWSAVLECVTELISTAAGHDCLPCACYAVEKVCGCHVPGC